MFSEQHLFDYDDSPHPQPTFHFPARRASYDTYRNLISFSLFTKTCQIDKSKRSCQNLRFYTFATHAICVGWNVHHEDSRAIISLRHHAFIMTHRFQR